MNKIAIVLNFLNLSRSLNLKFNLNLSLNKLYKLFYFYFLKKFHNQNFVRR